MRRGTAVIAWLGAVTLGGGLDAAPPPAHWVRSWGVAMQAPDDPVTFPDSYKEFRDVTIRQIVRPSLGGDSFRVWISNSYGKRALVVGKASIAHGTGQAKTRAGSDVALTFNGRPSISIPPGVSIQSDPVAFTAKAFDRVAVSLYLPGSLVGAGSSVHPDARATGYVLGTGDFTASAAPSIAEKVLARFYLSGLDVEARDDAGAIVAIGDSITDGALSTPDANRRWPDILAERLAGQRGAPLAVVNMGLSGNRMLHDWIGPSALSRFDRDVLAVPGVRYVLVLEGINDIGGANYLGRPEEQVSAEAMIGALAQLRDRAHAHGLKIAAGTLTPMGGTIPEYDTPEGEAKRQAVNAWLRAGNGFDAILDFDAAVRDPSAPHRLLPIYDSGDHLHPSDAGYRKMAESIDTHLFGMTSSEPTPRREKS